MRQQTRPWIAGGGATVVGLNPVNPMADFAHPRGDGKMAVRGAYGIYYDRLIGGLSGDQDTTTPGFVQSVTVYPNQAAGSDVRLSDGIPIPARPAARQIARNCR